MPDAAYYREYRKRRREAKAAGGVTQIAQRVTPQTPTVPFAQTGANTHVALSTATPAHAREAIPGNGGTLLPSPREPGTPRVKLCAPASDADYFRAKELLLTGLSMGEVCEVIGNGCTRASLMEAAHANYDVSEFNDHEQFSKRAASDRIAREAMAAGVAQDRVESVDEDGPKGTTTKTTRKRTIDVAALRLAAEHIDPERFGKLAGAKNADKPAIQLAVVFTDARRVDVGTDG
jgi:hypothetical protein